MGGHPVRDFVPLGEVPAGKLLVAELGACVDDSHVLIRGIRCGFVALDQDTKGRVL